MFQRLLQLLGFGRDVVQHLDEAKLAFQRPGLFWVGMALVVASGFLIYARQRRNLITVSRSLILALSLIRVTILALLVTVLAGPYLKIDRRDEKKPIVAFLLDDSQSMQLPAGPFPTERETARMAQAAGHHATDAADADPSRFLSGMNRAALVRAVVEASGPSLLEPIAQKYDLRCYTFAKQAALLDLDPVHPVLPELANPGGSATHLGSVLTRVLEEAAGQPIAGIVLFSDGQNTGGRSVAEAAHAAAEAGVPLYTVPAGSAVRLRDVSVVDVFTTEQVSLGDKARVAVTVESHDLDGRPVKVELREGDKLLDTKELLLRGSEQQLVELTFQATEPGPHYLTIVIPPLPEEPEFLRSNNSDMAFVRVSEDKLRVLHVEGLPRWDFRFLKNAMRRDHGLGGAHGAEPDIVLEAEWRRQSPKPASALPATLDDLAKYHTVILGDCSPALLTPDFLQLLNQAVRERGVGLVVAAGPSYMPHAFDQAFQDLLPVRFGSNAPGLEAPVYKPFRLEISPEGAMHETMRLFDDAGHSQSTWAAMPPYYWCAAAERPAPAASVLAWNPSVQGPYGKMPLIAQHYAGKGKVLFVGADSTWLWRRNMGDRYFYTFWGQAIRSVARREEAGAQKSWLDVRPLCPQPGEEAQIELRAFTAQGAPRDEDHLSVRVVGNGAADTVLLDNDPASKGRYTGRFTPAAPGAYQVIFDGAGNSPAEAKLRVQPSAEEFRHPNVSRPILEMLATASGGQLVEMPDLGVIPERLKGESRFGELHREASIWDNWLTLTLLAFLYCLDVGLRRVAGLS